ncbi:MAG: tyrosine-type recombinase/integrase [Candidatus Helarchaeota archaeon]|nr:tyrosine-type recombinase/integrase [Candidatus Helarchaeota archaeon]
MVIDIEFGEKKFEISGSLSIIEKFLEKKKKEGKSKSLIRNYRYDILDFCQNTGIQNIENILIEDLEDYVEVMRTRKCSGSTINRRISAMKSFVKYMIGIKRRVLRRKKRSGKDFGAQIEKLRNEIEEYEDISNFERVKAVKKEKLPFRINELKKILEASKELQNNRYPALSLRNYLILKFSAVGTGARNTAVRQLKKHDLDCFYCSKQCENCIPTVKILRKGKTEENQEERGKIRVRIEKQFCKELYQYIHNKTHNSDTVFLSRNSGELSIPSMNRILYKVLRLTSIEKQGRTFHSLRHTFITEGIKNGTPYGHMARQVDHEGKLGITGKYEHMAAKDLDIHFIKL